MPKISRRQFIRNSAIAAAAAGTVAAAPTIVGAAAAGASPRPKGTVAAAGISTDSTDSGPGGAVAHVVDPSSGLIALYVGTRQVDIHDRAMARALTSAAGE
jgi:anaerobic selenocysteine-containing dehydrogenase